MASLMPKEVTAMQPYIFSAPELSNFEVAFATFYLKYFIKFWYWKGTYDFISKSYPFTYYFTPFLFLAKILLMFRVQKYAFF